MKQNDFDYIKQQFDNSGVNAPDPINEQMIMNRIGNVAPVQAAPQKSKKKPLLIASAVAAVAIVTAGAITFTSLFHQPMNGGMVLFKETAGLRAFSSVDEVKHTMDNVLKIKSNSHTGFYNYTGDLYSGTGEDILYEYGGEFSAGNSADSYAAGGSSSGSAPGLSKGGAESSHNATYTQSLGVDEADTVKTDGKYIYVLQDGFYDETGEKTTDTILIYSADGANVKKVGSISEDTDGFEDFYVYGNRLAAVSTEYYYGDVYMERGSVNDSYVPTPPVSRRNTMMTKVTIYDISKPEKAKRIDRFSQSGSYVSSRMIKDSFYLVTDSYFSNQDELPVVLHDKGATPDSAKPNTVPAENIFSVDSPVENSFLVVSAFSVTQSQKGAKTKAIIGSADDVYCNQENLYLTAYLYTPVVYDQMLNYVDSDAVVKADDDAAIDSYAVSSFEPEQTQIVKISLKKDIEFVASNKVDGVINNQYSLDEYNGNLRVATTSFNEDFANVNNLYVLDQKLNHLGKVTGFAKNESIQAVRYINDTAYVITYEQTDPLFVIDVSDPVNPRITGDVKISGFSTMLVPVDDNTLLGIGYQTNDPETSDVINWEEENALKIVTFDVSDKANPKVLDTKIFPHYSSQVQYDPKALLVNFERGDYSIPMDYFRWGYNDYVNGYVDDEAPEVKFGLINFRVDNGKINVIDNYTSTALTGEYDMAHRCVYIGGYQYLIGEKSSGDYYGCATETVIESVKYK